MIDPATLDWDKMDGLIPAIVQDVSGAVRMLGYMNREALAATIETDLVVFFSRSKNRLWAKGESSGNCLRVLAIAADCDRDAVLVTAKAEGPTCHLGTASCFGPSSAPIFPPRLEAIIAERVSADPADSYTARLAAQGLKRMAQKVGEEGVEVALAAVAGDAEEMVSEAADLAFHLTLLLRMAGKSWTDVASELGRRHAESSADASS